MLVYSSYFEFFVFRSSNKDRCILFCFLIIFFLNMQIMGDKNLDDGDIEPAPKLIEVVFHNCRGQVDHWVEPYLRITVERLRRTEKPYLKCLLMQVVSNM